MSFTTKGSRSVFACEYQLPGAFRKTVKPISVTGNVQPKRRIVSIMGSRVPHRAVGTSEKLKPLIWLDLRYVREVSLP